MTRVYSVYGSSHCLFTKTALTLLARRGLPHHFIEVSPMQRMALQKSYGQTTIPYVFVADDASRAGPSFIGGCNALESLLR